MASEDANTQFQYMGSYVQTPPYPPVSATACSFRLPPLAPAVASCRLPRLRCSFPSLLHPHYERVKDQCDSWILGFVQPRSPAARRLLLDCLIPRLVCRCIPTATSLPRLIQVSKMVSWLTVADDEDDHTDALGADVAATHERAAQIKAILRCQDSARPSFALHVEASAKCRLEGKEEDAGSLETTQKPSNIVNVRALEALAQLWEEMCREMPLNLRNRFITAMADYLDAVKAQASYRKAHQLADMETFKEIRRQASFMLPCFCLAEYAIGVELEEEVCANPRVQMFRSTAVDYLCLCNDIQSCRMEIAVGDYFNMPSIVYNEEGSETFEEAINIVAKMIEDLDAKLISMLASINQSSLPPLCSPSFKAYITTLGYTISGSVAWFLESARYCNP